MIVLSPHNIVKKKENLLICFQKVNLQGSITYDGLHPDKVARNAGTNSHATSQTETRCDLLSLSGTLLQ